MERIKHPTEIHDVEEFSDWLTDEMERRSPADEGVDGLYRDLGLDPQVAVQFAAGYADAAQPSILTTIMEADGEREVAAAMAAVPVALFTFGMLVGRHLERAELDPEAKAPDTPEGI